MRFYTSTLWKPFTRPTDHDLSHVSRLNRKDQWVGTYTSIIDTFYIIRGKRAQIQTDRTTSEYNVLTNPGVRMIPWPHPVRKHVRTEHSYPVN